MNRITLTISAALLGLSFLNASCAPPPASTAPEAPSSQASTWTLGHPLDGRIRHDGDVQKHEFAVSAGTRFEVVFTPGGPATQTMQMYPINEFTGEPDRIVAYERGEGSRGPWSSGLIVAERDTRYLVKVSEGKGPYRLLPRSVEAKPLEMGIALTQELDVKGAVREHELSVPAGSLFEVVFTPGGRRAQSVEVRPINEFTGERERVVASDRAVASRGPSSSGLIVAERDMRYMVQVSEDGGQYQLLARSVMGPPLLMGRGVTGELDVDNAVRVHELEAPAGSHFAIVFRPLTGSTQELKARAVDPATGASRTVAFEVRRGSDGPVSSREIEAEAGMKYYVSVAGESGAYTVTIEDRSTGPAAR